MSKLKEIKKNVQRFDNKVVIALLHKLEKTMVMGTFSKSDAMIITNDGMIFEIKGRKLDPEKLKKYGL